MSLKAFNDFTDHIATLSDAELSACAVRVPFENEDTGVIRTGCFIQHPKSEPKKDENGNVIKEDGSDENKINTNGKPNEKETGVWMIYAEKNRVMVWGLPSGFTISFVIVNEYNAIKLDDKCPVIMRSSYIHFVKAILRLLLQ